VEGGALVTSFSAYQPRTFAVKFKPAMTKVPEVRSAPVDLQYDAAVASNVGTTAGPGFDGKGNALPAEMLPSAITFNGVQFRLAPAKTGVPDAVVAKGQSVRLPPGHFNRVYILAASADGDQKARFGLGGKETELNIQEWEGFIGQWNDREWSSPDTSKDNYGEMLGIKPSYIKRADLAWYCDHHHDTKGENTPYSYSYLFG
jgi:alpha-mannosidase